MTTTRARAGTRRVTGAVVGAVALGLLLGACATTTDVEPLAAGAPTGGPAPAPVTAAEEEDPLAGSDLSRVGPEQAAEIEDRVVTAEEYAAAFERYRGCMADAGHELGSVLHHDLVYRFVVSDAAVQDGTDDACYETEFHHVDGLWQIREEVYALSGQPEWEQECLRVRGVVPGATPEERHRQLRALGLDWGDCP